MENWVEQLSDRQGIDRHNCVLGLDNEVERVD